MTGEDLDHPVPGANECLICGLEIWSCACDPRRPHKRFTLEQIEAARLERLTRAERDRGAP
jgi:hypothetical protein